VSATAPAATPTTNRKRRPYASLRRTSRLRRRLRADRSILYVMSGRSHFTADEAHAAGEGIGIDWEISRFDVEQFRTGMDVELEHGTHDLETNVTDDDVSVTAKIARAHLNEFPDYYSRLAVMEAEAEAYWAAQGE
jgi:DNA-directed RNA polymerase alpha subunit